MVEEQDMKVEVDMHTYIPVFSDGYGSAPAVIVLSGGVKNGSSY